ncbi:hypothetical protein [Enemella sp. A6]|uniref:hypothetical protein n=1 Tax=Enemella sp. A6 TaxID=3440152 RepID=UPI003EBE7A32
MAKRPSKHARPHRPLSTGWARGVERRDGDWVVRDVPADRATKDYRCPGCQGLIRSGTAHVVAWRAEPPLGHTSAVEHRRHHHTGCWERIR